MALHWLSRRQLSFAILGGLMAFGLGAAVTVATGKRTAERSQTVATVDSEYFRVVNTDWPYALGATTCVAEQSDYYVLLEGPVKLGEGQYHATMKAKLGMMVTRANLNSSTVNGVFVDCPRCNSGHKRVFVSTHTDSEPPAWLQIMHDPTNDRFGFYFGGSAGGGGWFLHLSESEVGTDRLNKLYIGGEADENSELGPFLHYKNLYKTTTGTSWNTFDPDGDPDPVWDVKPDGQATRYDSITGEVLVTDFGFPGCP